MDLSNLRTSLREEESSSLRRTAHLRAAEDELNSYFRASALSLTTLYRQGVASAKQSYEKGYAHALAHVLELCDQDRDWLKGYLQRRIEALEATAEEGGDDTDGERQGGTMYQHETEVSRVHTLDHVTATAKGCASDARMSALTSTSTPAQSIDSIRQSSTIPTSNKRSRSSFVQHHQDAQNSQTRSSTSRMLQPSSSSSASSSRFTHPPTSTSTSASAFATSTFNFIPPTSLPHLTSTTHPSPSTSTGSTLINKPSTGGVIKTSTPSACRRRLHKLKGLRSGRERVIEITSHDSSTMDSTQPQNQSEILLAPSTTYDDAWTDDENETQTDHSNRILTKNLIAWSEKNHPSPNPTPQSIHSDKFLETLDRRKRRKTTNPSDPSIPINDQPQNPTNSLSHQFVYHS